MVRELLICSCAYGCPESGPYFPGSFQIRYGHITAFWQVRFKFSVIWQLLRNLLKGELTHIFPSSSSSFPPSCWLKCRCDGMDCSSHMGPWGKYIEIDPGVRYEWLIPLYGGRFWKPGRKGISITEHLEVDRLHIHFLCGLYLSFINLNT